MGLWIGLGVGGFLILALCAGGIFFIARMPNVTIYVDNGTNQPMSVFIDGENVESVPANSLRKIRTRKGEHRIKVTSAGKTIFDETKQLKTSRYVFDPQSTHRYWIRRVKYELDKHGNVDNRPLREAMGDVELRPVAGLV